METSFENSWADKTSSVIQTKLKSASFARPTWLGSSLLHTSGNHKQNFPRLIWSNPWPTLHHLRKLQYYQFSVNLALTKKSVSQSLNFVFLRAQARDFPFYFLRFHFRWKFFHISPFWSRFFTESITHQLCHSGVFVNFCLRYSSLKGLNGFCLNGL